MPGSEWERLTQKRGKLNMRYKLLTTSFVLSGSLALGAGSAFCQSAPETNRPGGNLPGTSQGEHSGPMKSPDVSGMEKQKKPSGMDLSSEEIKQIQQALKEKGHELGSATGVMSAQTREAIREFQKANNLSATRSVDEEIAQKLGVSISGSAGTGASGAAPRSESLPGGGSSGIPDFGSGFRGARSK